MTNDRAQVDDNSQIKWVVRLAISIYEARTMDQQESKERKKTTTCSKAWK